MEEYERFSTRQFTYNTNAFSGAWTTLERDQKTVNALLFKDIYLAGERVRYKNAFAQYAERAHSDN